MLTIYSIYIYLKFYLPVIPKPTDSELTRCTNLPFGRLSSPNYPQNYPNNVNYTRILTTRTKNTRWNFTIIDFQTAIDVEQSSCVDYLEVRRENGGYVLENNIKWVLFLRISFSNKDWTSRCITLLQYVVQGLSPSNKQYCSGRQAVPGVIYIRLPRYQ